MEPQALSFHTAVLEPCGPSRSPGSQRPRQEAAAFAGRFAGPVKLRADSAGPQAVLNPSQASEPMIQALQSLAGEEAAKPPTFLREVHRSSPGGRGGELSPSEQAVPQPGCHGRDGF